MRVCAAGRAGGGRATPDAGCDHHLAADVDDVFDDESGELREQLVEYLITPHA